MSKHRAWMCGVLLLALAALLSAGCTTLPVAAEARRLPTAAPRLEPVIAVAAVDLQPGSPVSVSGAGWQPQEVVYVNLELALAEEQVEMTMSITATDAEGRFATSFLYPSNQVWMDVEAVQVVAYSLLTGARTEAPLVAATEVTQDGTPIAETVPAAPTPAGTPITGTVPAAPTPAAPTPTSTVRSAPVTVPTATYAAVTGDTAQVTSRGLNLRAGPGVSYTIIRSLTQGTILTVLGQSRDGGWIYVRLADGTLGWVSKAYTDFRGSAPVITAPAPTPTATSSIPTVTPGVGWYGQYFANPHLSGYPAFVRSDAGVDFDWGSGSPGGGLPADGFSVRWSRNLHFDSGTYRFHVRMDDGLRLYVDGHLVIDEWRDGSLREVTADRYLDDGTHSLRVEYYENTGVARVQVWWERIYPEEAHFPDWKGEYFSNRFLDGDPVLRRNDQHIDFDWGTGRPDSRLPYDDFSVRWTRDYWFEAGRYRFYARADDGIRAYIGGDRVLDEWRDSQGDQVYSFERTLDGTHHLKVEYYERAGHALVKFWWERIGAEATPTHTPTATPEKPNPYADVSPASGNTGITVTAVGGGFPANAPVNAHLGTLARSSQADPTVYASTVTDRFGNYTLSFPVPAQWPNGQSIQPGRLVVLVATPSFDVQASAIFELVAPQPTVAPDPYAQVSPRSGGAGTRVTANGGGFPANSRIYVHLAELAQARSRAAEPTIYAGTTTDANGNYSVSFDLPARWPDGSAIQSGKLAVVVATGGFAFQASAPFDYFVEIPNPSIALQPASGGANTLVSVSGGGFPANATLNLYLGTLDDSVGAGPEQRYATGQADGNGHYTLSFRVPGAWTDGSPITTDRLVVLVATGDFSVQVSAVFGYTSPQPSPTPTATPTATPSSTPAPPPTATPTPRPVPSARVDPATGGPNTQVTVSGSHFPAHATVKVYLGQFDGLDQFDGDEALPYATTETDANGSYSATFAMPAAWPSQAAIPTSPILVLVATEDFSIQASTVFDYVQVEPQRQAEPTATQPPPPTATPTQVPTDTPVPPTATPEPPTATPEPPTATPEPPTATPEPPTATPEPPTATPEPPTATPEPPTATPEPPTATPEPATATPESLPTDTPVPPLATNTPEAVGELW